MIFVFYFFAAVLVWLSFKSFTGGIRYLRYFRDELSKPKSNYIPLVTVIAPCKGIDEGMEQNLEALLLQNYPAFEVVFVVDDSNDPAFTVIEEVSSRFSNELKKIRIVVAPDALGCGQKAENLREGVLHASPESEIFVFVDSDARPSKDWLRSLVAPLADKNVGAASGYRWFISKERSFASEMTSVWNASIASALGPNRKSNFCWGGSTAIRKDVFDKLDIREKWRGVLSDDFTLTHAVKDAGLEIVFVPQALTASFQSSRLPELLEFTNRQMRITRVYAPELWLMSMFGGIAFNGVLITAFLIVIFSRVNNLSVWISIAVILAVSVLSIGKSWLRLNAVKLALPQYAGQLRQQFWTQNALWLLSPALFLVNTIAAILSRRITWRGITYELKSPTETVIITTK